MFFRSQNDKVASSKEAKNDFPVLLVLFPVLKCSKVLILIFITQRGFDAQISKIYSRMGVYSFNLFTYSHPDDIQSLSFIMEVYLYHLPKSVVFHHDKLD